MTFEKSLKGNTYIKSDQENRNLHLVNLEFDVNWTDRNEMLRFVKCLIKKYNIIDIMDRNKDIFPVDADYHYDLFQIYNVLKGTYEYRNYENFDDTLRNNTWNLLNIAFFDYLINNFQGVFDFIKSWHSNFIFFFDEDKELAENLRNYVLDFMNDISTDNGFLQFEIKQELIRPNKNVANDFLGNPIKVGDIGVGNAGKGNKSYGLEIIQVFTIGKTYINGNIKSDNFLVLKPIDGRQIKEV